MTNLDLKKKLEEKLGEKSANRILTDMEDRFVYSIEKVFVPEDDEERKIPDIVVKVKSIDEANIVRQLFLEEGYTPIYRDRILHPRPETGDRIGLIDFTEPIFLPISDESAANFTTFSDLRMEGLRPDASVLQDKCEEHTICKGYCPIGQTVYGDVETWSSKGRLIISRELTQEGKSEIEHSKKVSDILYSCATCGNCFRSCAAETERVWEGFLEAKRRIIEEKEGIVPTTIRDALESTFIQGNPFRFPRSKRSDWINDIDVEVPVLEEGSSVEVLFFVGCSPSYEERNQEIAKSLAKILIGHLDLDVGILGNEENCCGNPPRTMGEEGLFEELIERNSEVFSSINFNVLLTASPHCYHFFKNEYPKYGVDINPLHYTQFLEKNLKDIEPSQTEEDGNVVAYHDSCYLDRHNNIHDEPRSLLKLLPDLEFVEIDTGALCCGGGGPRMWFDDPYLESRPAEPIIERALNKGADILAVACPFCVTNFEDSLKTMGLEEELIVKDISELIVSAL